MKVHHDVNSSSRMLLSAALLLIATGCAQCAPEQVGTGASRLTIRNVGAIVSIMNANDQCGFASDAVLGNPTMQGEVGGPGSMTWTVKECAVDLGDSFEVSKSCDGNTTTASGKLTVSATRTITGLLTGNPQSPIIPGGPDAVTIKVEKADFENFRVETSTSPNKLTMISGSISATLKPRMAVSASSGACAIATPNISFSEVTYGPSTIYVDTPDNQFEVEVDGSSLSAVNGIRGGIRNDVTGTISVWGSEVTVPNDGKGLDPEFGAVKFQESYACTPDLAQPISFTCADLRPQLAGGVARLTVRTIGTVTSLIDANNSCGFSSAAVAGTPEFTGEVGDDGATATFTIKTGCEITLPADTLLSTDCSGNETRGSGKVVVTGTKQVTGFRTGNPLKPIVPTSRDPASFDLQLQFTDFKVTSSASTSSLQILSGGLSGKVAPRTGLDKTTGACSISTPVVAFSDLTWADAEVFLESDGNHFALSVDSSELEAQNGTRGDQSNLISGAITVDGTSYSLAGQPLDVAFDQEAFDASYQCNPNLVVPPVDAACSFRQPLGIAAARLLVKGFATSTSMLNGNTTCGFAAGAVLGAPTDVTGAPGEPGSITWSTADCGMGPLPAGTKISTNCLGRTTHAGGLVAATATKTVTGLRSANPPIIPVSRDAATLDLSEVTFTDFELYDLDPGKTDPTTKVQLSGTGAVTMKPVGGESAANAGVYSISTPVASIEGLAMDSGNITIWSDGNQFNLTLADVALEAFAGTYGEKSNEVAGTLTVDGFPVTVAKTQLDPTFVQDTFNESYVCTPDLKEPIPAN